MSCAARHFDMCSIVQAKSLQCVLRAQQMLLCIIIRCDGATIIYAKRNQMQPTKWLGQSYYQLHREKNLHVDFTTSQRWYGANLLHMRLCVNYMIASTKENLQVCLVSAHVSWVHGVWKPVAFYTSRVAFRYLLFCINVFLVHHFCASSLMQILLQVLVQSIFPYLTTPLAM